ncbi:MAG: TonB-dependent receptor [Caulobacteraceae bacterium]|nr:TonB-dependent receptor [Caulobacteraceae bacterium]
MSQQSRMREILVMGASVAALLAPAWGVSAAEAAAEAAPSAGGVAIPEVVVTAQHKKEALQTVPISISAFSPESLKAQKIEGGPDLLKAIPNTTFTKTNFSRYNLTIRGIGTQAVSVATDPGVSVNFNGTALIRNRLFEQEFFDVERVEVLRGPQGTLYGRNATAGAVNVISAKPTDVFEGEIKGEVGNYSSRRFSGFINIPLVDDKLDLRIAGASTNRAGFAENTTTGNKIDGRDLYSTRVTLGFKPNARFNADFVWEHFKEDDSRARSTKQLCTRDPGPSSVGDVTNLSAVASAYMSQGCQDKSLYSSSAYGTPNGLSIPFVLAGAGLATIGVVPGQGGAFVNLLQPVDPYGGARQSTNLRQIASQFDPRYRAKADVFELNANYEITPNLTLTSQTAYNTDNYFASEDYNRFNTVSGVFNSTDGLLSANLDGSAAPPITPHGVFCDPQLGCSSSIVGLDESKASSHQFSQELRLQSSFSGPFNFSVGANYTYYKTLEDYYVFFNVVSALAESESTGNYSADLNFCKLNSNTGCVYIDPNKAGKVNNLGHNYYLNQNPYKVSSAAAFGEIYYKITPSIKLTAGLRYTDDQKTFTPIPTQLLLSSNPVLGGTVDSGYPALADVKQHWGAFTGRLGIDWSPKLSFTDQTLIYAFYNRGYKGGGANPPSPGVSTAPIGEGLPPAIVLQSFSSTFKPEYVNAFEIGTKNTLLGGALVLNADAFYYDYSGYQVSEIRNDTAINENFNAKIWGAEFQSVWQATHHLRFDLNLGYQGSRLANGSQSIDVMNRTQGNPDYTIFKPFVNLPDNCVISKSYVAKLVGFERSIGLPDETFFTGVCPGSFNSTFLQSLPIGAPTAADLPNGGQGFYANLSGHSLPNAPEWTQSLGAQYAQDFGDSWKAVLRADVYHQSQSWARVYQDPIDKLHGWYNVNLRLTVAKPDAGLEFEVYVKNLLDASPITGAFVNSDNTALTTNVFTADPRFIGASIRKRF